jgi:HEPN domain-containing protein
MYEFNEIEEYLKKLNHAESVSASQECIEPSIRAIFILLQEGFPKRHEFKEEEFEAILEKIPGKLKHLDFHRLYLYSKFWLNFYTVAKYGLEKIGVGQEKLFEKGEAELALKHADKCASAAVHLENYIEYPLVGIL